VDNDDGESIMRVAKLFGASAYVLFWGWNLWFALWLVVGLGPAIGFELVVATLSGMVPLPFAVCIVGLIATPLVGMALGLLPQMRRDPGRLMSLFYGVQAPMMLLLALRTFAVGVLSPATALALGVGVVGCTGLLWVLLRGPREPTALRQGLLLGATSAYATAGLWFAAVAGLYAATFGALWLAAVPGVLERILFVRVSPGLMIAMVLFLASVAVVLTYPVAMLGISLRTLQLTHRASLGRMGPRPAAAVVAAVGVALLIAFALVSRQPQRAAFGILDGATTDAARHEALSRSERVRDGLVAAALASERTFDADPTGEHLAMAWREIFGDTLSAAPRAVYRLLFAPFLYHPVEEGQAWSERRGTVPADTVRAHEAYGEFFDAPIEVAERDRLLAAARATWNWEDAQAGLLEVGQRKVHLAKQEIEVEPHGDLATVRLHDVYTNRTWQPQEVLVSFSLPETAAVTGLWLGSTDDRDEAFRFVVAPRGAAQQVYRDQLVVRRDPALLEQVGPRQYRLRAFPIPARTGRADDVYSIRAEGEPMHLWLELEVAVVDDPDVGPTYPLPVPSEVRNLFWDRHSERTLDGEVLDVDAWSPPSVPAPGAAPRAHVADLDGYRVTATRAAPVRPNVPSRLAVLVDGTRSMDVHRGEVDAALGRLRALAPDVAVLCTVEQRLARCDGYSAEEALFWGATALETRLSEAGALVEGAEALIVLTDAGSYELSAAAEAAGLPDVALPPLWLVHFGGFPAAWPDWTLDRIQRTGGGVGASLDEVMVGMADPELAGGYRFAVAPVGPGVPVIGAAEDPFRPIAARQLVAWLDRAQRSGDLDALDTMHRVAVANEIVTAYSSMIVLVDDAQRRALAEAEAADDRFEREVEGGGEFAAVSAVPEPGTWVLLGVAGLGLAMGGRRRAAGAV
jgi:putative PEP-CTERM system integral membrane protein